MRNTPLFDVPDLAAHFCLADGRTAALVTGEGLCDFWCAPHFDSPLRLAGILDGARGGVVGVLPTVGAPVSARWLGGASAMAVEWTDSLSITVSLLSHRGASGLAFLVEGPIGAELGIRLGAAGGDWTVLPTRAELGRAVWPDGPGGPLLVVASEALVPDPAGARMRLSRSEALVWLELSNPQHRPSPMADQVLRAPASALRAVREELARARAEAREFLDGLASQPQLATVLNDGPEWARASLLRSVLTLRSLQDRASGLLVASPLTSIPQWPGSERAWDYRYAWLRDCADAGMAFVRAGAWVEARRLAVGLATRLRGQRGAPVARLDGGALPPEHLLEHLSGYGGGLVRIGNAAAEQLQVDTLGEVMRFIELLDRSGQCPEELLEAVPWLADQAAASWRLPDHGIWEVRGEPRHYLHSKLLAWAALDSAVRLRMEGRLGLGSGAGWERERDELAAAIRARGSDQNGALKMAFDDPSADSSTLAAYVIGHLDPGAPTAAATLDRVTAELSLGPLLARHRPERDGLPAPCAPFIFPSLWAVIAEARLGRREAAEARLRAIVELAGPAGQLSEVALPSPPTLLGNYPQVQSHAAMVEAILELFGSG